MKIRIVVDYTTCKVSNIINFNVRLSTSDDSMQIGKDLNIPIHVFDGQNFKLFVVVLTSDSNKNCDKCIVEFL